MRIKLVLITFCMTLLVNCQQSSPKQTENQVSILPLVGWGDSMMGGSGTKNNLMEYLEDELGRETRNFGVGGITSEAIALLQGGKSFYLKPETKSFPEKGALVLHNFGIDPYNKQT